MTYFTNTLPEPTDALAGLALIGQAKQQVAAIIRQTEAALGYCPQVDADDIECVFDQIDNLFHPSIQYFENQVEEYEVADGIEYRDDVRFTWEAGAL